MKIGINFPYGNFNFGDYSTTFSDLILKGTRVRGLHTSIKIGFLKKSGRLAKLIIIFPAKFGSVIDLKELLLDIKSCANTLA